MLLQLERGELSEEEVGVAACGWLLQELRRFAAWGSPSVAGYAASSAHLWATAEEAGLASLSDDGAVELHLEQASELLLQT